MAKGNAGIASSYNDGMSIAGNSMGRGQAPRPQMAGRTPGSSLATSKGGGSDFNLNDISGSLKNILAEWKPTNQTQPVGNTGVAGGGMGTGMFGNPFMGMGGNMFMPNYYSQFMGNGYGADGKAIPVNTGIGGRTPIDGGGKAIPVQTASRPGGFGDTNQALSHINSQLTRGLNENELGQLMGGIGLNRNYQGAVSAEQMSKAMDLIRQNNPSLLRGAGV